MDQEVVPEDALLSVAENCLLSPEMLANQLINRVDYEGIRYSAPQDRKEQIYQILYKWKEQNPLGTWQQLRTATDSGVGTVMRSMSLDSSSSSSGQGTGAVHSLTHLVRLDEHEEVKPSAPPPPSFMTTPTHSTICCHDDMNVEDYLLSEDQLGDVLDVLVFENKWHDLGIVLRIPAPLLDEINSNHRQISDCRKEMVRLWLRGRGKVSPSWRTLCHALRSQLVGNVALANKIAGVHQIM